ncbi:MAG TPA: hypothetical protein ENI33_09655 [Thermoplasmatales archaeon]|nr:hypothetical protein [Thermoplasmatales archaeon]
MAVELILVGVGHVFDIRKKIEEIIEEEKPDAVAVELDFNRALVLQSKERGRGKVNFLYYVMAKLQNIIAKRFSGEVGGEMISAINKARSMDIPLYYIDMDSREIINKLWSNLSFRKKISILLSSFLSLLVSRKRIEREIKNFEKDGEKTIKKFEEEMPELKGILIDERNEYMANKLRDILNENNKVVAIVGEGHVVGLKSLLNDFEIKIIHLSQLL